MSGGKLKWQLINKKGEKTMEGTISDTKPMREAYWEKLDDPGKIERLRRIIKDQERLLNRVTKYLNQLIDHEHLDGKMVQQISHPNAESYGGFSQIKRRDEWF